ncbi:hypothetical protein D3C73_1229030 [compost metagenome]
MVAITGADDGVGADVLAETRREAVGHAAFESASVIVGGEAEAVEALVLDVVHEGLEGQHRAVRHLLLQARIGGEGAAVVVVGVIGHDVAAAQLGRADAFIKGELRIVLAAVFQDLADVGRAAPCAEGGVDLAVFDHARAIQIDQIGVAPGNVDAVVDQVLRHPVPARRLDAA